MSWSAAELLPPSLRRGQPRFHALTDQVVLELSDPRQHCGHHPAMWRNEFEGHAFHCDDRDLPSCQSVQRGAQILCRSPPPGELGDKDGIDFSRLCGTHHLIACGKIGGFPWRGLPEYPRQVLGASLGEGRQIRNLTFAGLVRGGNPGVDGRPLAQSNLPWFRPCKSLIYMTRIPDQTDYTPTKTIPHATTQYSDGAPARCAI